MTVSKQKTLTFVLTFATIILSLLICFTGAGVVHAGADAEVSIDFGEGAGLKTSYKYGDVVEIPEATLNINGENVPAQAVVIMPDGTTRINKMLVINTEGKYTIRYRAIKDGKLYYEDKSFVVEKGLFSVKTEASSVEWGTYNAEEHNQNVPATTGSITGVKVSLVSGDVLSYNKVIDLRGKTPTDLIVKLCLTPAVAGVEDIYSLDFTFTDAYAPENKLVVNVIRYANGHYMSYVRAKAPGQQFTGWEWSHNPIIKHVGDIYGFVIRTSFYAELNAATCKSIADNNIGLSFDYEEKQLFSPVNASVNKRVCDFDDSEDFNTLWDGFTTGECFLSISSSAYTGTHANFVLTEIDGQELTDNFEFKGRDSLIDVDYGPYSEDNLPYAVVGKPYKLFGAKCLSPYFGELNVVPHVYLNYYSPTNRYEIDCSEGYFTPSIEATYTLVYEATDFFGDSLTKIITVNSKPLSYDGISINNASVTYTTTADGNALIAGELITFAYPQVNGGSGGSENATITYFAELGGETTEFFGGEYRPYKAGSYKISVVATDYCGRSAKYETTLSVAAGSKPVFIEDPALPPYFISGKTYAIPALNAYDFTDGSGSVIETTVKIQDDAGVANVYGTVIPVANGMSSTTTVTYTAYIGADKREKSYSIPTIKIFDADENLLIEKLLYGVSNVEQITAGEDYSIVTVDPCEQAVIDFVNPLLADNFNFQFRPDINSGKFSIYFTDTADFSQAVKFTYANVNGTTKFSINDSGTMQTVKTDYGTGDFNFRYEADKRFGISDAGAGSGITVTHTLYGEPFNGFSSGKVYVRFIIENVTARSNSRFIRIYGQTLGEISGDYGAPRLGINGDYGGAFRVGETVLLPSAYAVDVIDPYITLTFSVTDSEENEVVATDGTLLKNVSADKEYYIKIEDYGGYTVSYFAVDDSGNRLSFSYKINAPDSVAPVITLKGSVPQEISLGSKLIVPEATATDNMTADEDLKVNIYLITYAGQIIIMQGREFTPLSAGTYTVRYWCVDAANNFGSLEYRVVVR